MKQRVSMARPGREYEAFLFAPLGDDSKGTPLSVASILGRMSLDPWNEAASLAALPADVATRKLASLFEAMPNQRLEHPEAATLAARLIKLLPTHPIPAPSEPGPMADASPKEGRRPVVYLIWLAIVC